MRLFTHIPSFSGRLCTVIAFFLISLYSGSQPQNHYKEKTSHNKTHGRKLKLEDIVKKDIPNSVILKHTGYTVSYNYVTNTPNWVAWELTSEELGGNIRRKDFTFMPDTNLVSEYQIDSFEYGGSGYDRGHMCPAGDMTWKEEAMRDCFYMSNICPQVPILNQRYWEHLESACRRWAKNLGAIYIVCGPIYEKNRYKYIGKEKKIAIPDAFFKVIVCLEGENAKGIGFYYTNSEERQTMESAATTIDRIEELTHFDFFSTLDKNTEKEIESQCDLKKWR